MSVFATVAQKSFNGKFTAKFEFPIGHVAITDSDIGSLKSLRIIFGKYLDCILAKFEQNCMVGSTGIQNFELFGKK